MIVSSFVVDGVACGYVVSVLSFEVTGVSGGAARCGGQAPACPQRCPEGPWRLAGPGWRVRHRVATPKAPLTWEGRPRRLRGTAGGTHGYSRRALFIQVMWDGRRHAPYPRPSPPPCRPRSTGSPARPETWPSAFRIPWPPTGEVGGMPHPPANYAGSLGFPLAVGNGQGLGRDVFTGAWLARLVGCRTAAGRLGTTERETNNACKSRGARNIMLLGCYPGLVWDHSRQRKGKGLRSMVA